MNGQDAATATTGRVFVSYAHDPEGRALAAALCRLLRRRDLDVLSDHELNRLSPPSLPAWMDEAIAKRIVLCVLSSAYVRAFAEIAEGTPVHKGVRYELRAIRQRIYDHDGWIGCPIIPVASPGFNAEDAPATLRNLAISCIDPDTESGIDLLVARIAALEGTGDDDAMNTEGPVGSSSTERTFRQVMHDLEIADPLTEQAVQLVKDGLRLAVGPELAIELLRAFPLMEGVLKTHGDARLMRTLSAECLRVLRSTQPLLRWEYELEPRVLISGVGWCLQRDHRLPEALDETQRGVQLAEKYEDRRTTAFGRKSIGRIRRLLAEEARGPDRDYHLRVSAESLDAAAALFSAVQGNKARRDEVGVCLSLGARTKFTRYRLLGDKCALDRADELARQADEHLPSGQEKDVYDLAILRAEISAARRRYADARMLLGNVIESLISKPGALFAETRAHAYVARARIALASRGSKDGALRDLRNAREVFRDQELEYAVACCDWAMLKIDSKSVTPLKITHADVIQLEDISSDPRTRLRAIEDLKDQNQAQVGKRASGRKINWENLVNNIGDGG